MLVKPQDPDRCLIEQRAEAVDRDRLGLARFDLGGAGDNRREHDRDHLERLAVLLARRALVRLAHHVEGADHLWSTEQRHADQRLIADPGAHRLVDPRVVRAVLDQDRLTVGDREAGDRPGDRPPRVERADRGCR